MEDAPSHGSWFSGKNMEKQGIIGDPVFSDKPPECV